MKVWFHRSKRPHQQDHRCKGDAPTRTMESLRLQTQWCRCNRYCHDHGQGELVPGLPLPGWHLSQTGYLAHARTYHGWSDDRRLASSPSSGRPEMTPSDDWHARTPGWSTCPGNASEPQRASQWGEVEEGTTTIVVQNTPTHCSPERLLSLLQLDYSKHGHQEMIDFLYLPYRSRQRRCSRYAILNFVSAEYAREFCKKWNGQCLDKDHPLVCLAARVQGFAANMILNHGTVGRGKQSWPLVFYEGRQVDLKLAWDLMLKNFSAAELAAAKAQVDAFNGSDQQQSREGEELPLRFSL
eukprot:TRINITY_DN10239_c0_g1_i2.p1 TRINITY_DN10239_c0_g1~~TRINITY_DN10239_c0_g1_i2.p1  ORF type:complete len:297 (+),score=28.24 TRINITY_DN10239_c0_g1_i2:100-990(+)